MGTIDIDLLRGFCAVAEAGGFSAAAVRLGVPKSSVSRGVTELERQLGLKLFHRTTRKVALSSAGAALYERVAPPLASLGEALQSLPERDDEPAGVLRVTTLGDLAEELVGPIAAQLTVSHPRLTVELVLTDRPLDLVAERIDVALRVTTGPVRDPNLTVRRVGRIRMQLYAAPSYLARRPAPRRAEQLAEHDWALLRGVDRRLLAQTNHVGRVRVWCSEGNALRAVLCAGAGIGVLPSYLAADDVAHGRLVPILPRSTLRALDLSLVFPARELPRKALAFRDAALAALAHHPLLAL